MYEFTIHMCDGTTFVIESEEERDIKSIQQFVFRRLPYIVHQGSKNYFINPDHISYVSFPRK